MTESEGSSKPLIDIRSLIQQIDVVAGDLAGQLFANGQGSLTSPVTTLDLTLRLARSHWGAVLYVAFPESNSDAAKMFGQELALTLPTLTRTLFDLLFNTVFTLEDLPGRIIWRHKSAWKSRLDECENLEKEYGGNPDWANALKDCNESTARMAKDLGISQSDQNDIRTWGWRQKWPNPGGMVWHGYPNDWKKRPDLSSLPLSRQFLAHLNTWFYSKHSAQAHGNYEGLLSMGALIFRQQLEQSQRSFVEDTAYPQHTTEQALRATTLFLSIATEISHGLQLGNTGEFHRLWQELVAISPETGEIYKRRYELFGMYPVMRNGKLHYPQMIL